MALLRGRLLAGALFAGLLFGEPTTIPSSGGGEVSGGSGGGRVTFGKPYPGYDRQGFDPREQLVVDVAAELQESDEETIIAMVMAEAVMRYYT